jgi:bifunctional enzyme CysN/CysC
LTNKAAEQSLLRFLTAGSVDDGKSTLIGRLLYEADGIYEDHLASVRKASSMRNIDLDLSLLTDGLRAEREQGITIDVAYRYFSTPKRKFIIADVPGHEEYTRNMATGASTAELALLLVDARKGILSQTRRHSLVCWLFGIRQIIVSVNKMDLVGFDERVFCAIREEFNGFAESLEGVRFHFIPLSALQGDNVTSCSHRIPWYQGPCLLELLETVPDEPMRHAALRFPVQAVIRPSQDFRGYAGHVGSGTVSVGQEVVALPSGQRTRIKEILFHTQALERACASRSVVLTTTDHIDLGRGDMLVTPEQLPSLATKFTAHVVWMSAVPLRQNARYLVKHTTKLVCGTVSRIQNKIDISNFETLEADSLQFNEIGEVQIDLHSPIFCDPYRCNRTTGSLILIDPLTNDTVGAGMIVETVSALGSGAPDRSADGLHLANQQGLTIWFTGLSGSGKTTICQAVATELLARGLRVEVIDGDMIRNHLCKDLGFSKRDRDENIRRIAFIAQLLTRNGIVVLVSAISPYREARDEARRTIGDFMEVYVDANLAVCELRDPKELYRKARSGQIRGFTGVDDPYEPPLNAELLCNTELESVRESSLKVVEAALNRLSSNPSRQTHDKVWRPNDSRASDGCSRNLF